MEEIPLVVVVGIIVDAVGAVALRGGFLSQLQQPYRFGLERLAEAG